MKMDDSDDQQQIKNAKNIKLTKKTKKTKLKNDDGATKKGKNKKVLPPPTEETDTESENDSEDESENENKIPFDKPKNLKKTRIDDIVELKQRQLFVVYPVKLPRIAKEAEDLLKPLNKRIIKVRLPQAKSTKWCLLDFATQNDRNEALEELRKVKVDGAKLTVNLPKLQDQELLNRILEKRREKRALVRQKRRLKKEAQKQELKKDYTSTLVVKKIPSSATSADIKNLFPDTVDMRFTVAQGLNQTSIAYVTLPSPQIASKLKKQKYELDGVNLLIEFARPNASPSRKRKAKKTKSDNTDDAKKPKIEENETELIKPKQKKIKAKKPKVDAKSNNAAKPADEVKPVDNKPVGKKPAANNKPIVGKKPAVGNKPKAVKNIQQNKVKPDVIQNGNTEKKMNTMVKAGKPAMKLKAGKKENGSMQKKLKPNKQKKTVA